MLALAKLSIQPNMHPLSGFISPTARAKITERAWPVFASLSWAFVMYLFRWHPEAIVESLRNSMTYMYVLMLVPDRAEADFNSYSDSDHWTSFQSLLIRNKDP